MESSLLVKDSVNRIYRVDNLLRQLNLYEEGMSAAKVNEYLSDGYIKYLDEIVDDNDQQHAALYNTEKYGIDFGDLKNYSLTDIINLNRIHSDYKANKRGERTYDTESTFNSVKDWKLVVPPEAVDVDLIFGDDPIIISNIMRKKYTAIAHIIDQAIQSTGRADDIYEGRAYANLNILVTPDNGIRNNILKGAACQKIAAALYRLYRLHPKFEFYSESTSFNIINCYYLAYMIYHYSKLAYERYLKLTDEMCDTVIDGEVNQSIDDRARYREDYFRNRAIKEVFVEEVGIEVNDAAFASIFPFQYACINKPESSIMTAVKKKGSDGSDVMVNDVCNDQLRDFSAQSLLLTRILGYNKDYIILKVQYSAGGGTSKITLPVPWNNFCCDFSVFQRQSKDPDCKSYYESYITCEKGTDKAIFNNILQKCFILTKKNSTTLRKPTVNLATEEL